MIGRRSRIVLTPGEELPYKVVLEHDGGRSSEHAVATIKEGEALIRASLPEAAGEALENLRESPTV